MTTGGRNLLILGTGAIFIAAVSTGISLTIYRETGDIYLDRSRPGFLPDKEETEAETQVTTDFTYSDTGTLDADELDHYLKELDNINQRLEDVPNAFSSTPLSDESLGITTKKSE